MSIIEYEQQLTSDYDEGAADALMFLHADRRAPSVTAQPPRDKSPPNSLAGTKRPSPPSPELSRPNVDKKSRGSPFATSPTKRQTVIEVLNAPSRDGPAPSRERDDRGGGGPRIEVLNKPHDKPLRSPLPPRSPEIAVKSASKPPSPKSPPSLAERGSAKPTTPPAALASTPAPTSDTRTSPFAVRSPEVSRATNKSQSPEQGKRSPVASTAATSPKAPLSAVSDKQSASNQEDVEMADAEKEDK